MIFCDSAQIHNEKKLLEFETFEYCNTSDDEETEEDANVQQIINADQNQGNSNRPQELPRPVNSQRNVAEIQ